MEHLHSSIASMANRYFKNKEYVKAWSIYTYLSYFDAYAYCKSHQCYCEKHIPVRYMKMDISQRKMRLFVADVLARDGYIEYLDMLIESAENEPEYFLSIANLFKNNHEKWFFYINKYLEAHQCVPISKANNHFTISNLLSIFQTNHPTYIKDEPLVTICMSSFNAENTIEYALASLQHQTYNNLEIYVIDDCSTDNTSQVVQRIAEQDTRIKLIKNEINCGTYVNRNRIYKLAKGKYFTVLDADDYALPDRIQTQVTLLESQPQTMATLSNWLRITPDGEACFKFGAGGYLHESVATMMVKTDQVRSSIGYWDCVRIAADTEYMHRIKKTFGRNSIVLMKRPTTFALYHKKSLTSCKQTGITEEEGLSPVRLNYRVAWKRWHLASNSLFLDFPLKDRPFQLPTGMPVGMVA